MNVGRSKAKVTRDQILFDSPNYFTTLFYGPLRGKGVVALYRDPHFLHFIESHLSGYQILPLPTTGLPQYVSHQAMVKNLFADAQFYQLDGLIQPLRPLVNTKYRLQMVFIGSHDSSYLFDSGSKSLTRRSPEVRERPRYMERW